MAMCVIAVAGVAPCQCFSPGGNQTTSPGRISSTGSPHRWARPQPETTMSVCPSGWVCQAVWVAGSNVTLDQWAFVRRVANPRDATRRTKAHWSSVTFEPATHTAWHTHPLGQTLIVVSGCGRAQRWGEPVEEIRPGDVVWFPPGEK